MRVARAHDFWGGQPVIEAVDPNALLLSSEEDVNLAMFRETLNGRAK